MTRFVAPLLLSAGACLPLLAVSPPSAAQVRWKTPPADAQISERALQEGVSGEATVTCSATAQGVIDACRIENEQPEGYGFGQSAIEFLQSATLEPSADGQPIAPFRIRVPFQVEEAEPQPELPVWISAPRPTADDYPRNALDRGITGHAAITCTASPSGVPESCQIAEEMPRGSGFGAAGLRIVQRARLSPTSDGQPYPSFTVRVPFNFY